MNNLGALRGTRMGRPVKTEKQVLEEIASIPVEPISGTSVDMGDSGMEVGGEDLESSESDLGLDPSALGISVRSLHIEREPHCFTLQGLDTPDGYFEELGFGVRYLSLNHRQWEHLSLGRATHRDGKFIMGENAFTPRNNLAPMKAVYWAMAAAYQYSHSKGRNQKAAAMRVRAIIDEFLNHISPGPVPQGGNYFADVAHYHPDENYLELGIQGHTCDSLFYHENKRIEPCPKDWRIPMSHYLAPGICKALLGEENCDTVAKIIEWTNRSSKSAAITFATHLGMDVISPCQFTSEHGESSSLNLTGSFDSSKPAMILYYSNSDFTPAGGKR